MDVSSDSPEWYSFWWIWALGAALFTIAILAFVTRGRYTPGRTA